MVAMKKQRVTIKCAGGIDAQAILTLRSKIISFMVISFN